MVLCLATMLSIMVVGAGAAFSDQSSIDTKHQEAVDACNSLNIITGYPNGSFQPNEPVTREQSAKMICVLLNGGKDPVLGSAVSSFTDVANDRWSCPYIESCVTQDIIVGVGNNKFAPAGKVTGSQLAKMLLVALGYSPDHQKYSGSAWEVNVNTDASARGFYKDLEDINPSEPLSREHAAQMIWNALNATEVEYKSVLSTDENGQLTSKTTVTDRTDIDNNKITLLEDKYGIDIDKGILVSVEKNSGKDTYTIKVLDGRYIESYTNVDKDFSNLLGQEVKVMIKDAEKVGDDDTIIGVYATDNNTVVTAQKGDMDDLDSNKATVNGETYKPDSSFKNMEAVPVYFTPGTVYAAGNASTVGAMADYQTLSLIDNDGDGKIDIAICTPVSFAQIKTLTSEDLTLKAIAGDDAIVTDPVNYDVDDGDITLYDGAAKDDYVIITAAKYTVDGTAIATKADIVTGTIDAKKGAFTDVKADGSWYSVVANEQTAGLKLNKTFDMAALGTYVFAADKNSASATAEDVLFVDVAAALRDGVGGKDGKIEAKVYFANVGASSETITISEIYAAGADDSVKAMEFCNNNPSVLENKMWMFDKDGSDYVLTELKKDTESLSFDNYDSGTYDSLKDGKATGGTPAADMRVDDNSVVFVKAIKVVSGEATDSEVKVISGKTVADWSAKANTPVAGLYDTDKGYNYIQVGAIILKGDSASVPGSNDWYYGYVLAKPEIEKTNDGYFYTTTVWDGTSSDVEVIGECATKDNAGFAKGDFIAYTLDSENHVDKIVVQTLGDATANPVVPTDAVKITAYDTKSVNGYEYDDDAAKIGVNVKDTKGADFTIDTADGDTPNAIIFYVYNDQIYTNKTLPSGAAKADCDIAAIFVASNNKMVANTTPVNSVITFNAGSGLKYNRDFPVTFTANPNTCAPGGTITVTATRDKGTGTADQANWTKDVEYQLTLTSTDSSVTVPSVKAKGNGSPDLTFTVSTSSAWDTMTITPSAIAKTGA